ncbi:hypothetical protein AAFP35_05110 [Gordonia sp. CPCC 206044]|uniref:hypothetical protein n=1 Tax=Gordonia sp. CPCC 206044 TaxID=3140793 RepID=UPI003AF35932
MFSLRRLPMFARISAVAVSATALSLIPGVSSAGAGPNGSLDQILPPGFPCIHTNVYPPIATWGWTRLDGAEPAFAVGQGASGNGYLHLFRPGSSQYASLFHPGLSTPLDQLAKQRNALGFMYKGTATTFQIRIRGASRVDSVLSGFTTLVWQPQHNGNRGANGFVTANDLARGKWWSTQKINGQTDRTTLLNLTQIAENNPRAWVSEYGVRNGTLDNENSYADNIVYGCSKWDFEPDAGS